VGGYEWLSLRGDGNQPVIEVPAPGLHTVDLWMREDGARIDRLLLTRHSVSYSGREPAESPRHPVLSGDLDEDGDVDLRDWDIMVGRFPPIAGDLDQDLVVDSYDFFLFLGAFGHSVGDPLYNPDADLDDDGAITFADHRLWLQCYRDFTGG
jgi:hypothetical protein